MSKVLGSIDVETTGTVNGLNRESGQEVHEIAQISVALFDEHTFEIYDKFDSYVRPMNPENITEDSMKRNKIPLITLLNAPTPMEVRYAFHEWVSGQGTKIIPVGWNYDNFDKPFLVPFFGFEGYNSMFEYYSLDIKTLYLTLKMFTTVLNFKEVDDWSLTEFCRVYEIPHKPHDSMGDVYAVVRGLKLLTEIIEN